MTTPTLPNLSPLQRRKRSAIIEGAKTVFLIQDFGLATMDDVAAATGVGKHTVYRHLKSREALYVGLLRDVRAGGRNACRRSRRADGRYA